MPALVNLLQVECVRQGTRGYRPNSALPFIDLCNEQANLPEFSDHATQVANLWQAHGAVSLVNNWYVSESIYFETRFLAAGRTIAPQQSPAHVVIMPYGESCTWTHDACQRITSQSERDNVLYIKSPSDGGQGFHQCPCQAVGDYILTVASTTTGSESQGMPPIDLYLPVDWNSYVQPSMLSMGGILALFDWLLQNSIPYRASDIKALLIATALPDSQGRKILNGAAALAAAKAKYAPPLPAPLPPVVPPDPTPVPVVPPLPPVVPVPPVTPPPVVPPASFVGMPVVSSFNHGQSSSWSSPANPTTFHWTAKNYASLKLTDPKGQSVDVTGLTSYGPITGIYTASNLWNLTATNPNGSIVVPEASVHGCL